MKIFLQQRMSDGEFSRWSYSRERDVVVVDLLSAQLLMILITGLISYKYE
jgi:hypothetical protein